jgi:ketosteroid isomerase-like protein
MNESEEKNIAAVRALYAAFDRDDMATVMSGMTDDIEWILPGPPDLIPFAGSHRGREAVARFFVTLNETLEFEEFEAREFLAHGDKVVVLGRSRDRMKANGRVFDNEWATVVTMREGRVARYQIYEDTAAVASALR